MIKDGYDPSTDYTSKMAPFRLSSGALIDILDPDLNEITIDVIARGLSLLNRFGGQTSHGYSVAAHSVLVSHLAAGNGARLVYEALMHDYTEALGIVDLPSPIKRLCPGYKLIETRVRYMTASKFGLELDCPPEIKALDILARRLEQHYLQGQPLPFGAPQRVCSVAAECCAPMTPAEAEELFRERYRTLRTEQDSGTV